MSLLWTLPRRRPIPRLRSLSAAGDPHPRHCPTCPAARAPLMQSTRGAGDQRRPSPQSRGTRYALPAVVNRRGSTSRSPRSRSSRGCPHWAAATPHIGGGRHRRGCSAISGVPVDVRGAAAISGHLDLPGAKIRWGGLLVHSGSVTHPPRPTFTRTHGWAVSTGATRGIHPWAYRHMPIHQGCPHPQCTHPTHPRTPLPTPPHPPTHRPHATVECEHEDHQRVKIITHT